MGRLLLWLPSGLSGRLLLLFPSLLLPPSGRLGRSLLLFPSLLLPPSGQLLLLFPSPL